MIEMLSGALLFSYLIAGAYFFRFWRRIGDRLFLHFAAAFWLFALNQLATSLPSVTDETAGYEYLLRVLGFVLILVAIIDKNLYAERRGAPRGGQGSSAVSAGSRSERSSSTDPR
jgi:hypothetical protein